jgi:type II pantothenate kinase
MCYSLRSYTAVGTEDSDHPLLPFPSRMPAPSLPDPKVIRVNTRGAVILSEESSETRDSRGIYFPNYIEPVSHVAVDVGGSLAKVVYFTRSTEAPSPETAATIGSPQSNLSTPRSASPTGEQIRSPSPPSTSKHTGALTPLILESNSTSYFHDGLADLSNDVLRKSMLRRTSQHFPGGSLNFERFETDNVEECVHFIQALIERSAKSNNVSIAEMRQGVKIIATGGGAHRFYDLFHESLQVEVLPEDEMECLIKGLRFITLIPDEVYYFSDELIDSVAHPSPSSSMAQMHLTDLERPSPNPPQYAVTFESNPTPQLPCLLVNIGSGVSLIKVDEDGKYERVSGTSLGGGTLWGLLSLLTPATSFDGTSICYP